MTQELLKTQSSNFRALSRTIASINVDALKARWEYEEAISSLSNRWAAVDSLHWQIDRELNGQNSEYEEAFTSHEKTYQNIKKTLNTKMWSVSYQEKVTPQIEIPTFSGSYQQWCSFKDLFGETIHCNPSLSDAQKLQFLKGKVKGEAEKLIQHLTISSENYEICWEILNNRYNNKKLIFTSHITNLLNVPTMQFPASAAIKKLHDTINECLHAIKNLGIDISNWDPLIIHLLSQKLDPETHSEYIKPLKNPREIPILKDFLQYLETKFTSLEASRRKIDNIRQQPHAQQLRDRELPLSN